MNSLVFTYQSQLSVIVQKNLTDLPIILVAGTIKALNEVSVLSRMIAQLALSRNGLSILFGDCSGNSIKRVCECLLSEINFPIFVSYVFRVSITITSGSEMSSFQFSGFT